MDDPTAGTQGNESHRAARLVLAVGMLAGLVYLVHKLQTQTWMVGLDFRVYRSAAEAALSGDPIYGTSPLGIPGMTFKYPPVVLLAFLPTLLVPWQIGYVVHTLLVIGAGLAFTVLIDRYLTRCGVRVERIDRVLIAGFVLGSAHAMPSLVYGQVNHFVALALAVGFVALEEGRDAQSGGALALGALPKVFPAAVGLWLLRRRSVRGVVAALTTGVGSLALGIAVFGLTASRRWVTEELFPRMQTDLFAGGLPASSNLVTVRRPLSILFPTVDPALYGVGALLVLAPVAGYLLTEVERPGARPVALFGLLAAILLYFPSSYLYLVYLSFPLIPLLYLFDGPGRGLFIAGSLLLTLPVQRDDLAETLSALPPGTATDTTLLAVAGPLLSFGTPLLYGLALSLAGCIWWRYKHENE